MIVGAMTWQVTVKEAVKGVMVGGRGGRVGVGGGGVAEGGVAEGNDTGRCIPLQRAHCDRKSESSNIFGITISHIFEAIAEGGIQNH